MNSATAMENYRPRRAWFQELVDAGGVQIKLSAICAEGRQIGPDLFDRARAKILATKDQIARTPHHGAGFAILHEGNEGRWLLLHWWVGGGVATRLLWRADLVPDAPFIEADPLLMACVWELGLIDFERRAWIRTAMSGKPVSAYAEDRFSGEHV